jgi:hypothetical protein
LEENPRPITTLEDKLQVRLIMTLIQRLEEKPLSITKFEDKLQVRLIMTLPEV